MDLTQTFLLQSSQLLNRCPPICTQLRDKCFNECMEGVNIDVTVACKWCYSTWTDGKVLLKVEPQNKKIVLKKCSPPTKHFNVLVLKCLVCQKKSKILMAKGPKSESRKKTQVQSDCILPQKEEPRKVKKKKRKDKFAGLNPAVIGNPPQIPAKFESKSTLKNEKPSYLSINEQINNSVTSTKKNKKKKKKSKKKKKQPSSIYTFINDC